MKKSVRKKEVLESIKHNAESLVSMLEENAPTILVLAEIGILFRKALALCTEFNDLGVLMSSTAMASRYYMGWCINGECQEPIEDGGIGMCPECLKKTEAEIN